MPNGSILVDFPLLAQGGRHYSRVVFFHFDPANQAEDVAVLELQTKPKGCTPATFCSDVDLYGFKFEAYGYADGYETGAWSEGKLGRIDALGLLQLTNTEITGYAVEPGFSGTPVWVGQLSAVAGIVVSSDKDPNTRVSFLIPTAKLASRYPDLSGLVRSKSHSRLIEEELASVAGVGKHQIRISEAAHGKFRWRGGIAPVQFGLLWKGRTDFLIAYEPAQTRCRDVSDALLRAAIHGSGGTLFVAEPDRWKERSTEIVNKCLGTNWDRSSPSLAAATARTWGLQPLTEYEDAEYLVEKEYSPTELSSILNTVMDLVLLERLSEFASEMLVDGKSGELAMTIESELATEMWVVWQEWEATLRDQPELLSHFFRVMMSKADVKQLQFAQARVGLHTLVPCLLRSVIFALAIRVCLPWDFRPVMDERHANIVARHGYAHLCGLQLIEAVMIVQKVQSLMWETDYVILPHFTDPGEDIPSLSKSFMNGESKFSRLDKPTAGSPLFLTGDGAFLRAILAGKHDLQAHLQGVVAKWITRQEKEIDQAVEGAAHAS